MVVVVVVFVVVVVMVEAAAAAVVVVVIAIAGVAGRAILGALRRVHAVRASTKAGSNSHEQHGRGQARETQTNHHYTVRLRA